MTREMAGPTGASGTATGLEIAVIGMSGRFPGAKHIHEFQENLKNGIESISFFTRQELEAEGAGGPELENSNYVKAFGILEDVEYFDANFFGYTPGEADLMDPQMRIFHECAWSALEDAGYCPDTYEGLIGIYAGASAHPGWQFHAYLSGKAAKIGEFAAIQFTDKDFLCTMVSYRFNLKGPAVIVQTACSTSLAAIHMACQAVLNGECDLALAGGVNITMLKKTGHIYQEGMIVSPDGHCRAFDAKSRGTIGGDGVGIVVLKRMENAAAENDHIYAVVKGSALNNDGLRKVGYTAPSIEGQAEVIIAAQEMAEVEPESITYIETHGTGTQLGDPVEIDALKLAFNTDKKGYCAIGSVKTNMGHLNAAAGVTGFIKAVLAIYHAQIPPSLHFERPNPKIDFENSPFYVNTTLKEWKNHEYPLRAGVSSFGIGGTNAHVVLEEFPGLTGHRTGDRGQSQGRGGVSPPGQSREYQLILLSAKTEDALEPSTKNLKDHFNKNPELNLADAAYTLHVGRKAFKHRRMLVCSTVDEAVQILSDPDSDRIYTHMKKDEQQDPAVIFMFPGQGAQYVNMALELYQTEPIFQEEMDHCFEILKTIMGHDIKEILYPVYRSNRSHTSYKSYKSQINQTEIAQPLIFIIEYALAKLLMNWGIKPYAMIGHSIGEYTAACLSGVFSLKDALNLVTIRGQLMQQMPEGSMLSVSLAEDRLIPLLNSHDELSLAAVNSTTHCVVSGPYHAIDAFARHLKEKGHESRQLHTSHAFHSKMMEPMLEEFEHRLSRLVLKEKADIPYISNVTGTWASIKESASPRYWTAHIRNTVRFGDGITELLKNEAAIFVEVGPGRSLSTFVRSHENKKNTQKVIDLMRHPKEEVSDTYYLLNRIGLVWIYGEPVDWTEFHGDKKQRRIPLPTYPFKGQPYSLAATTRLPGPQPPQNLAPRKESDIADWFYIPSWSLSPMGGYLEYRQQPGHQDQVADSKNRSGSKYLVLINREPLVQQLVKRLKTHTRDIAVVKIGPGFSRPDQGEEFIINPHRENHYHMLFKELAATNRVPRKIIHCWNVTGNQKNREKAADHGSGISSEILQPGKLDDAQDLGFYSLLYLAQAMGKQGIGGNKDKEKIEIIVLTDRMQAVTGQERLEPLKALLRGPLQVIPLEYPDIACRGIDIDYPRRQDSMESLLKNLETEIENNSETPGIYVAYRNNLRWTPTYEQNPLEVKDPGVPILKEKGVYLVTGGLGRIGLVLAEYLAKTVKARLILTGPSSFPGREQWDRWLDTHEAADKTAVRIGKIREMEAAGAEVLIFCVDVTDMQQMRQMARRVEQQWGHINGIIHSAGLPDAGGIPTRTREMSETVMAPKVKGTLVLETLFCSDRNRNKLDFMVLCSSIRSVLSTGGQVAYSAANAFLDSYAYTSAARHHTYTVSIGWDSWQEKGMAQLSAEGVEVFRRVLAKRKWPRLVISYTNLVKRIRETRDIPVLTQSNQLPGDTHWIPQHHRPELSTRYVAPETETQRLLAQIWRQFLGIQPLGIHDDFFELGGDSLKVMTVSAKIHKELDVEIPLTEFFNRPTIKKLDQYIKTAAENTKGTYTMIEPVEDKEYHPLSPAQERMYMLQQMDKNSAAYHLPFVFVLEGQLNQKKLERVFSQLIRRQESFRTSFILVDGEGMQKVHNEAEFKLEYYDLQVTGEGDRCRWEEETAGGGEGEHATGSWQLAASTIKNFIRPFDLTQAPLLRVGLIKTAPREHILMLDMHHIISDGTSIGVFVRELMALYEQKELPRLPLRYKDYSQWQKRQYSKKNGAYQRQGDYWLKEFAGKIPGQNLPTDFPRPDIQVFAGNSFPFTLNSKDTTGLKNMAARQEVSLFTLLLALVNVLISKLTGQEDILIGTQIAGRKYEGLHHIIGLFLNTLVLRNHPNREKTFPAFLEQVKKRTLKAFENQEYQFEDLVEKVMGKRELNRNPFFDVMFIWQNFEMEGILVPGLILKPYKGEMRHAALIDLSLYGQEQAGELMFMFEYNTALYKKETIERFIKYLKEIISSVTAEKEIKLKEIKISHDLGTAAPGVIREEDEDFAF